MDRIQIQLKMTFVLIEIVEQTADNRISKCKVRGIFPTREEAENIQTSIGTHHRCIIVPNISMEDIPLIRISDYQSETTIRTQEHLQKTTLECVAQHHGTN